MSSAALTRAAVEIQALIKRLSAAEVARKAKTSRPMVSQMATGRKTPGTDLKDRLVPLGIPVAWWDEYVEPDAPARTTVSVAAAARRADRENAAGRLAGAVEDGSAISKIEQAVDELDDLIADAPITQVASLVRVKVSALSRLAVLRGEGEITTAAIRRSKAWHEMLAVIEGVIVNHPEAARALKEAFAKLT